jgi:3-methyladenine DNA glycosylase AlkC
LRGTILTIMKEKFSLKDHLFNKDSVTYLADLFVAVDPDFNKKKFVSEVVSKFPSLELKARIGWITEVLAKHLPSDPGAAMKLIVVALPPPLDPTKTDDDFGRFIFAPLGEYVVQYGCTKKYLKQSLATLKQITMRFSMEDAMRTFLNNFPTETLAEYDKWVSDKNYHVRRLVSESTRPSLPWSQKISIEYKVPVKYLDILHADTTRYVTRSVANHLNDISKKDGALVVTILKRWHKEKTQNPLEVDWLTRHALRTLVKRGNADALALLGYAAHTVPLVSNFVVPKKVTAGNRLQFSFDVMSSISQNLLIDYVIDFVKLNGGTKPKVFKIKKIVTLPHAVISVEKNHHLKADATTFKLNAGTHSLTIQINGQKLANAQFEVV